MPTRQLFIGVSMVEREMYVIVGSAAGSIISTLIAKYLGIVEPNTYIIGAGIGAFIGGAVVYIMTTE